jgi:hypothetical protein
MTLGWSPPTVCICGHDIEDHAGWYGLCRACECPIFETDHDR